MTHGPVRGLVVALESSNPSCCGLTESLVDGHRDGPVRRANDHLGPGLRGPQQRRPVRLQEHLLIQSADVDLAHDAVEFGPHARVATAGDHDLGRHFRHADGLRAHDPLFDVSTDLGVDLAQDRVHRVGDLGFDVGAHGFVGHRDLGLHSCLGSNDPVGDVGVKDDGLRGGEATGQLEVRAEPDAGITLAHGPVLDGSLLGIVQEQRALVLLQGPKVQLLHQVGNALVHCHQVQDPHVIWQVTCCCRLAIETGVHRRLSEIHAPAKQVAAQAPGLEAVFDDGLSHLLAGAVVQHRSRWHLPVRRVEVVPELHHPQPLAVLAAGSHQRRVQLVLALKPGP